MQSASPDGSLQLASFPGAAWKRTRAAVPNATLWSAVIAFLLVFSIAKSTVAAAWVSGIEIAPMIALAGALLMGVLAVTPLPWWLCVGVGMALGPVVAGIAAAPAFRLLHPLDPAGFALVQAWFSRLQDGSAFADSAFELFVISWLMWVTGAWLSWCVLRWRQPLIGLIPGAAAFATNVLNDPADQNGYVLGFLGLTLALLLWSNYTGSIAKATKAHVKLTGDARWDFWESGAVAMAGIIVLGVLLPPLSSVDRTQSMQSSLFSDWAQLQQELNHPTSLNSGAGGAPAGNSGFSLEVTLGGPLKLTKNVVFTYTVTGAYPGPKYFRGVNVTLNQDGAWKFANSIDLRQRINKSDLPPYGENYQKMALATFTVNMLLPPVDAIDVLFYPGQLYRVDRETIASEVRVPPPQTTLTDLMTIDRLSSFVPPRSNGVYNLTTEYPDVGEAELRAASTAYQDWLTPYMSLPQDNYRPPEVLQYIHDLASTLTAGTTNPYDAAMKIQDYLRGPTFRYTLTPKQAPDGVDPLFYFLNTSHEGYCQYFATAMGDMLRSLGIPTRLVNGFGAGTYDTTKNRFVVRGEDAHTWVESYFPGYGWIPFEPTNDGTYFAISRSIQSTNVCLRDNNCDTPTGTATGGAGSSGANTGRTGGNQSVGGGGAGPAGIRFQILDAGTLTRILAVVLAVLLLLAAAAARYLRPRTVAAVWKRTLVLARLAGSELRPGETPLELGRRLAGVFPEASASVRALANGFVVAAYAPPDMAQSTRSSVMEAWGALRPMLLRRAFARFRPGQA